MRQQHLASCLPPPSTALARDYSLTGGLTAGAGGLGLVGEVALFAAFGSAPCTRFAGGVCVGSDDRGAALSALNLGGGVLAMGSYLVGGIYVALLGTDDSVGAHRTFLDTMGVSFLVAGGGFSVLAIPAIIELAAPNACGREEDGVCIDSVNAGSGAGAAALILVGSVIGAAASFAGGAAFLGTTATPDVHALALPRIHVADGGYELGLDLSGSF